MVSHSFSGPSSSLFSFLSFFLLFLFTRSDKAPVSKRIGAREWSWRSMPRRETPGTRGLFKWKCESLPDEWNERMAAKRANLEKKSVRKVRSTYLNLAKPQYMPESWNNKPIFSWSTFFFPITLRYSLCILAIPLFTGCDNIFVGSLEQTRYILGYPSCTRITTDTLFSSDRDGFFNCGLTEKSVGEKTPGGWWIKFFSFFPP